MRFEFCEIELNTDTQELRHTGELIHVEPQVLAVLEYLITHRDRVVTKIELLDEVWGDRFVSESALTSRIKSARRVCGDNGREQRVIRTIHGRGYRFVATITETTPGEDSSTVRAAGRVHGLVGREAELSLIDGLTVAAANGQRSALFLTGDAGVGKSALLAEIVERIDDPESWHVLVAHCLQSRGGTEPYFALLDSLSRDGGLDDRSVHDALDRVAPSWLAQLPNLLSPDDVDSLDRRLLGNTPERMLREGAAVFEELARSRPVILVLEDLHWADGHTLDVLELLMQRSDPARMLLVASARNDWSMARGLISAMTASGRAIEVGLDGLAPAEVDVLVSELFDGAFVPESLTGIIRRRGDGIPLFVLEMVSAWKRSGQVEVVDGHVRLLVTETEIELGVPDTLRQLVERDLARIDPSTIDALQAASIVGAEFDAAAVAAALTVPVGEVDEALTTAGRELHYFDAVGGSRWPDGTLSTKFAFTHELYRQVLHDRFPLHARARAHAAIGLALERGYDERISDVVVRLAHHFVEAGDHVRAVEYLRLVGEQAASRNAYDLATAALLDALGHVGHVPSGIERDRAELRIRMAMGPALVATRGWYGAEVAENYERAMALCTEMAPCPEAPFARYGLATVTELRGEYDRTAMLLQPLLGDESEVLLTEARELMACSAFHKGEFQHSLDHALAVLRSWDGVADSVLMSRMAEHPASACNSWASLADWYLGRSDESLGYADDAVAVGEQNPYALSTARVQRAFLHQLRGEPEPCRSWAVAAIEVAQVQGFPMRTIQAEMLEGWAESVGGDPAGVARMDVALDGFRATGARLTEPYFIGLLAHGQLTTGEAETALQLLEEAISLSSVGSRLFFYTPELHRLKAHALLGLRGSDDVEARSQLELARHTASTLGSPPLELRALVDLIELDPKSADRLLGQRLGELVAVFDGQQPTAEVVAARELLVAITR